MVNHIHKYKRINIGAPIYKDGKVIGRKDYPVYRCTKPDCKHYVRPELLEGKIAECGRCESSFVCDKSSKNLAEPHCSGCTNKKKDVMNSTMKFIEDLEKGV